MPRGQAHLQRFSDGEVYFQLLENVRGADVFVVQPTCYPVDQHLMELLLMIDALKRASARRITPVIPYLWICAAGPQGQAARGGFGEAGGGSVDHRGGASRAGGGFARAADSGIFQYSGGSFVRFAGAGDRRSAI